MAEGAGSAGKGGVGTLRPGALSALLQEIAAAPASASEGWESGLRPGAVVGRFELIREIGRGGFGVVWEAKDRELGRRVAFKAVRTGARRDLREERLLREAEAAARLSHPNLVTLFDVGRAEQGPYLVLELLEGETLGERLAKGPLPSEEALRIAAEIAKGVAHAHGQGVVHRDLKPENVFLCRDGQVKVLDFGLAHAFGQRRQEGGTSGYMAPEQVEGAPEDERTDVWAMGAMLFEMLSGQRPFEDEKALRKPAPALEVPGAPGLGDLVARMLSLRPVDRPRDGGEVLRALEKAPAHPAQPSTGTVRTRHRLRHRLAGLIALGILAGVAIAGAVTWWQTSRTRGSGAGGRIVVAVADVVNETGEKELDVLSGLLVTSLEQSRRLSVMTQARVLDLAARAGRKDASRVDETIGREVGKASGVRALLIPAIRRLGTTYSLEMRAIDPGRDEHLFTLSDRATSKEGLLDLLDRLSERTRLDLGEGRGEVDRARVQLGVAMTRSVEAYQRYLAGLEARQRHGLRAKALSEYLAALELDPGFAAAQGQLAGVFHTYGRGDLSVERWRAAEAGIDRMPVKERMILQLQRSFDTETLALWSKEDALRLAGEIEARFPDDKFALVFASAAYDRFDEPAKAERNLRRALDLDPGYFIAAWSLSERLGAAEALEVARRAVATSPSPVSLWLVAEALRVAGDDSRSAATAREVLRQDGARNSFITQVACDALYQAGSDAECLSHWKRMAADGQNEYERDFARFKLMDALAFRGRIREALRVRGQGRDPSRVSSPYFPGRFSTRPGMLAAIHQIGFPRREAPQAVEHARRITHPQYRRNWLAFLGAVKEAEVIDRSLESKGFRVVDDVYRYYDLVRDGRLDEAMDLTRKLGDEVRRKNVVTSLYGIALLEAEALVAAGRTAEAAEVRPAPLPCRCSDPMDYAANYPRLALLRARAMEQLGRRADALREMDGVVAFWKDADHDLPLLVEAKAMRRRLAAAPAAASAPAVAKAAANPSIAVLPFADMSPGRDQEYFADGVAEEILNALARVEGLKVIGRTSSFSFRGKKDDLRTIGRKLGAAMVLEGSVRKDGGLVRVTARLVKAADGDRVWSDTYQRELTGIFAVQDEIAKAVVESLKVSLASASGPGLDARRTASPEAHDRYLLGLHLARRGSQDGFRRAEEAFRRAIALDPGYALAHVGLASALVGRYNAGDSDSAATTERLQRESLAAAERAVQLAPGLAEAWQARGMTRFRFLWDWGAAERDMERALELDPSHSEGLWNGGRQLAMLGRVPEGLASLEKATRIDPLSVEAWRWLGYVYLGSGDRAGARRALRQALDISPEHDWALVVSAMVSLSEGQAASALETMERSRTEGWRLWGRALAHHALGNEAESRRALEALTPMWAHVGGYQIAEIHAWRGDREQAFEWLERCYRDRDSGLILAGLDPLVRGLRRDPRWGDLRRRMKLPVE